MFSWLDGAYVTERKDKNMNVKRTIAILAIVGMTLLAIAQTKKSPTFYCKYCGHKASSVASLTASMCIRHPDGPHKGRHALYEGSEKEKYTCKYCGKQFSSISSLTASKCIRHPAGPHKGNHVPAL